MISYLLAMDLNGTIGKDNDLPWHLPADLAYFKRVTMGHCIVMGRKTYESIGRPLPGRKNIVMTRNLDFIAEGCEIFHSPGSFIESYDKNDEAFIIGGARLFESFMPYVDKIYITLIEHEFIGDTAFSFDKAEWTLVSDKPGMVDEKNIYPHRFQIYEKHV